MFQGTKLKALTKQENRSDWHMRQPKMIPFQYENVNIKPKQIYLPGKGYHFGKIKNSEFNEMARQNKLLKSKQYFPPFN